MGFRYSVAAPSRLRLEHRKIYPAKTRYAATMRRPLRQRCSRHRIALKKTSSLRTEPTDPLSRVTFCNTATIPTAKSTLHALVIGRSNLFGKPMAQLLLNANATVTIGHSRSRDLPELARQADILVAAVGRAEIVKADWLKPGATVIDVGINRVAAPEKGEGKFKLVGDVAFAECKPVARAISPVPGGVGPMTIAMLMANTVIAAHRRAGVAAPSF